MKTKTKTAPAAKKAPKIKYDYLVYRDGIACGLADPTTVGLGFVLSNGHKVVSRLIGKRGVLVPGVEPAATFNTELRVEREVARVSRIVGKLRGSLVDEHPALQPLLRGGAFTWRRVERPAA